MQPNPQQELEELKTRLKALVERYQNWMPKDPTTGPLYTAGMMEAYMNVAQELSGLVEPAVIATPFFSTAVEGAVPEEITEVKVVLTHLPSEGQSLYEVCKAVRAVNPMSLPDSIQLIRKVGREEAVVKEGVPRQEALQIQAMFKKAGAKVELI